MADTLRIRMLLEAGDRFTRPLRDLAGGSSKAAQNIKQMRDRLREVDRAQKDMAAFRELKTGLRSSGSALDEARAKVTKLGRELANTEAPTRKMTRAFETAKKEAAGLERQHGENSRRLNELRERLSAGGVATTSLARHDRELRGEASRLNSELAEQSRRLAQVTERSHRLSAARKGLTNITDRASGVAATGAGSIGIAVAIGAPIAAAARGAMNLEEGMAGVAKVTGLAGAELGAMQEELVGLSTRIPMTSVDLANIAAAAGAAGVGMDKFGKPLPSQADDLVAFTDAAARMGIAFDMTAEDAGGTMAKWRQAFQLPQQDVEALGDRINALTNRFGGKAADVSDVVTRIGPLGKVAGIAAPQIAALGSSLSSIGVENEIAATGIKNTLLALTKGAAATKSQTKAFDALGLSATDVAKRMQANASGTIVDVFERLARLSPDKQASMLDNLFGSESIGAIAPLLTNLDGLKQRLGLVGDQSQFAGSMMAEFRSRTGTTASALALANNNADALGNSLGARLNPTIKAGSERFSEMAAKVRALAQRHPVLAKTAMIAATGLAGIFAIFGVGAIAIAGIMGPIAILNAGLVAMGYAGGVASIGLLPIIGTIAAVVLGATLLAGAAYLIYSKWDVLKQRFGEQWDGIKAKFTGAGNEIVAQWDGVKAKFVAAGSGIVAAWTRVSDWFNNLGPRLRGYILSWVVYLRPLPGMMTDMGRNMIAGLINGITGMLGRLKATIVNAATAAADWFKQKLGIHSPSRVFMGLGGFVMQGLDRGIQHGAPDVLGRLGTLSRRMAATMKLPLPGVISHPSVLMKLGRPDVQTPGGQVDRAGSNDAQRLDALLSRFAGVVTPDSSGSRIGRLDSLSRQVAAAIAVGTAVSATAAPAPTPPKRAATAAQPAVSASAGDRYEIHLHAAPGMDEAMLVRLLERRLAEIDRAKAARGRSSFADQPDWG